MFFFSYLVFLKPRKLDKLKNHVKKMHFLLLATARLICVSHKKDMEHFLFYVQHFDMDFEILISKLGEGYLPLIVYQYQYETDTMLSNYCTFYVVGLKY